MSNNNTVEPPSKKTKTEESPPSYGSQEYWETRYEKQFQALASGQAKKEWDGDPQDDETLPYHAWYFTYNDLRPLLLPLILGGREEARDIMVGNAEKESNGEESDTGENKPDYEETSGVDDEPKVTNEKEHTKVEEESKEEDSNGEVKEDDDDFEEVEGSDTEEEPIDRDGLAKDGPISVIEIGCGDVPLGVGLALELKDLEHRTSALANNIVKRIVCTDYSEVVVQAMKEQHKRKAPTGNDGTTHIWTDVGDIPLEFAVADARKLPYPDASFELVLEKGTLDAMLSDNESGVSSSIAIVKECARVLTIGGYMMLISHLNAHTAHGIGWLEGVVFEGLRAGGGEASFEIEVHGNDEVIEDEDASVPPGSSGPAVYIISKKPAKDGSDKTGEKPTIPVKFFSY